MPAQLDAAGQAAPFGVEYLSAPDATRGETAAGR